MSKQSKPAKAPVRKDPMQDGKGKKRKKQKKRKKKSY